MLDELTTTLGFGRYRFPVFRSRPNLALLGLFVGISQLRALSVFGALGHRVQAELAVWPFFSQFTGALGVWFATPVALWMVYQNPHPRGRWFGFTLRHLGGFFLFSFLQLALMFSLRFLTGRLFGYAVWRHSLRFELGWELQQNLIVYAGLVALIALLFSWEEQKKIELARAKLDASAANSRLEALTNRIDPHFLFNTLNTVSEEMFRDPNVAERLLADLGEILRATLDGQGPTWTLGEELTHVNRYVGILQARFGPRLSVSLPDASGCRASLVPRFSIQSLVENAVKHNRDRLEPLMVAVVCQATRGGIMISVEDNGEGFPDDPL